MISLARLSLRREWPRFLPAVLAVGFCGVLVSIQLALLNGIFETVSVYIDKSTADLWVGSLNTLSIDLGQDISGSIKNLLLLNPEVESTEELLWVAAEIRREGGPVMLGQVLGVSTRPKAMMLAGLLSSEIRERLEEPDSILIDFSLAHRLHLPIGKFLDVNTRRVKVVGITDGLAGIAGANIVASKSTARRLARSGLAEPDTSYFLVHLKHPAEVLRVRDALLKLRSDKHFSVWTADEFSQRSRKYWLLETGVGLGFAFSSLLGLLIGLIITNQTLKALIRGAAREFATLRAIGVPRRALYHVVLEQSGWVGFYGAILACAFTALFVTVAQTFRVLILAPLWSYGGTAILVLLVAILSGVLSLRTLSLAEPARLLR